MRARRKQSGVTLVELVLVLIVVGIFGVYFMTTSKQVWRSVITGKDIEDGLYYAQACADHVIASRRNTTFGYPAITVSAPSAICDSLPAPPAGLSRTVNVNNASVDPLCLGGDCKSVNIVVKSGATTVANIWIFLIP